MIRECEFVKGFDWYRTSRFVDVPPSLFGGVLFDDEYRTGRLRKVHREDPKGYWYSECFGIGYNYETETVISFRAENKCGYMNDEASNELISVPNFHPVSLLGVTHPIDAIIALVYIFVKSTGERMYYVCHYHEKDDGDVLDGWNMLSPNMLTEHLQVESVKEEDIDNCYISRAFKGDPFRRGVYHECHTVETSVHEILRNAKRAREAEDNGSKTGKEEYSTADSSDGKTTLLEAAIRAINK